ncbi:MAG: HD domain-containing phosphohydrolase [Synergistales bacterium]
MVEGSSGKVVKRHRFDHPIWGTLPRGPALFFLALVLWAVPAAASEPRQLRVGIYENMPKIFTSESGKPSGIFVDIIEEIAAHEGWTIEYVRGTWSEGLERLELGQIDLMPDVAFTSDRERRYAFTRESVLSNWSQLYAKRGSGIRSILDVEGKRISTLEGSVQQEAFRSLLNGFGLSATLVSFPDYPSAFRSVSEGKTDVAIANRFFGAGNRQKYNLEDTAVIFNPAQLYFAASRTLDPGILEALDRNLAGLKKNPESIYYRSIRKWTAEDFEGWVPPWMKTLSIVLGSLTVLGGIGTLVLKGQVKNRTAALQKSMAALESAYRHWESTFNAVQDAVWVMDADSNILLANPASSKLFGVDKDEFIAGRNCREVRKEIVHEAHACPLEAARREKTRAGTTVPLGDKWVKVTIDPILDSAEKIRGFIHIMSDITEMKKAQEQLAQNEREIRTVNGELKERIAELRVSWEQTLQVLANVSESRDPYTAGHQRRVAELAVAVSREMGLSEEKIREIELAALVHDTGKIEIPSEILAKPGKLSELEFELIKTHPEAALKILQSVTVNWPLAETIHQHHERLDGSGYPRGLSGEKILLEARILAVADVMEAMSSHRPYRAALGTGKALEELLSLKGVKFDPLVVEACVQAFSKGFSWEREA